jgi:predicted RNase H-like nuclease (RuvC/YqgF family)
MYKFLILIVSFIFLSCSNTDTNSTEKQNNELKNKEYVDSIKRVAVESERNRNLNKTRLKNLMLELANSEEAIGYFKTEIPVQKDNLEQLKLPKLLRTPAERENQIRNKIQEITDLENQLQEAELSQQELIRKINSTRQILGLKVAPKSSLKKELAETIDTFVEF